MYYNQHIRCIIGLLQSEKSTLLVLQSNTIIMVMLSLKKLINTSEKTQFKYSVNRLFLKNVQWLLWLNKTSENILLFLIFIILGGKL